MENLCFHFFRTTSWRCRIVSRSVILLVLQSGIQHIFSLGLAGFQLAINRLVMSPVLSATLFALYLVDELDAFFSKTSSFFGYLAAAQVTRTLLTVTPRKAREAWTPSKQGAVGVILSKSKNLPVPLVGQRPPKYHNDTSQVGIAFAYEGDQGMFIRDMYIYIYVILSISLYNIYYVYITFM